ncbi:fatty acid synthase alpha subunit Lsd1, partial [Dispira parvispora]
MQGIAHKLWYDLQETAEIRRAIVRETKLDFPVVHGAEAERAYQKQIITPRANLKFAFPKLKYYEALQHLSYLRGTLDLDNVVV